MRSRMEVALHPRLWSIRMGLSICAVVWLATALLFATPAGTSLRQDNERVGVLSLFLLLWSFLVPLYWIADVIRARVDKSDSRQA